MLIPPDAPILQLHSSDQNPETQYCIIQTPGRYSTRHTHTHTEQSFLEPPQTPWSTLNKRKLQIPNWVEGRGGGGKPKSTHINTSRHTRRRRLPAIKRMGHFYPFWRGNGGLIAGQRAADEEAVQLVHMLTPSVASPCL